MAEKKEKLYLELQMEELKAAHAQEAGEENPVPKKNSRDNSKNAEIAKMYEDAAEYEEDLKGFEEELEIVNANELKDITAALIQKFPNEERDYAQELRTILEMGWTHFVEVEKTHPKEQLELIKETEFGDAVEKLSTVYPDYDGDFETEVRDLLIKRWENLIAIKKDHIQQELAEIKTTGLKPKYVKRVYEQFHGITK
jgi:molybdopterin converting factor small subunit